MQYKEMHNMKIFITFYGLITFTDVVTTSFGLEIIQTQDPSPCLWQLFKSSTSEKAANGTQFKLFTRNTRNDAHVVQMNFTKLGPFIASRKNVFICHGFNGNGELPWILDMKNAFLDKEDVNLWTVDWEILAAGTYAEAVGNAQYVGLHLAEFITFLSTMGSSLNRCHLIGHSLGAHVVGFAGEALGGKVARLSALDAAGPVFEPSLPQCRVDKTDAAFVDAMHTDMGTVLFGDEAMVSPIGHIDFYFNGGSRQPGCDDGINFIIDAIDNKPACSHQRSYDLYTETIRNPNALMGFKCSSYEAFAHGECTSCEEGKCAYSGYNANNESEGTFHVATRYNSPYTGKTLFATIKLCMKFMFTKGRVYLTLHDSASNSSDTTDIIYKTTSLLPSTTIYAPAVVFPSVANIDSGSLTFFQETLPFPVLTLDSPGSEASLICIESIKLLDSETNNQVCYEGGIDTKINETKAITFKKCS